MTGQILVGGVEVRFVATAFAHPALQVVGNHHFRHTPEIGEGADMGHDPVLELLTVGRFRKGVIAGTQHCHEDLCRLHLAGLAIDDIDRLAGIIDEHLFAGPMFMPHHHIQATGPLAVVLAKPAVLVAISLLLLVLLPEQMQGDMLPGLQFPMDGCIIRDSAHTALRRRGRKQQLFQGRFAHFTGKWPAQPGAAGALDVFADRAAADAATQADFTVAAAKFEFEAQYLTYFSHR